MMVETDCSSPTATDDSNGSTAGQSTASPFEVVSDEQGAVDFEAKVNEISQMIRESTVSCDFIESPQTEDEKLVEHLTKSNERLEVELANVKKELANVLRSKDLEPQDDAIVKAFVTSMETDVASTCGILEKLIRHDSGQAGHLREWIATLHKVLTSVLVDSGDVSQTHIQAVPGSSDNVSASDDRYQKLKALTLKYKKQVVQLEDQVLDLTDKYEKSSQLAVRSEQNSQSLQTELDRLNNKVDSVRQKNAQLKADLHAKIEAEVSLKTEHADVCDQLKKLRSDYDQLGNHCSRTETQLKVAERDRLTLSDQVEDLGAKNRSMASDLSQLENKVKNWLNVEAKMKTVEDECALWRQSSDTFQAERDGLAHQLEAARSALVQVSEDLERKKLQIQELEDDQYNCLSEMDSLRNEVQSLRDSADCLKKARHECDSLSSRVAELYRDKEEASFRSSQSLGQVVRERDELKSRLTNVEYKIVSSDLAVGERDKSIAHLRRQLQDIRSRVVKLTDLDDASSGDVDCDINDVIHVAINRCESIFSDLRNQCQEAAERATNMETTLSETRLELASLHDSRLPDSAQSSVSHVTAQSSSPAKPVDEVSDSRPESASTKSLEDLVSNLGDEVDNSTIVSSQQDCAIQWTTGVIESLTKRLQTSEMENVRLRHSNATLQDQLQSDSDSYKRVEQLQHGEFVKNIVLKIITMGGCEERLALVPVLESIMKLTAEEVEIVRQTIVDGQGSAETSYTSATQSSGGWQSLLPF